MNQKGGSIKINLGSNAAIYMYGCGHWEIYLRVVGEATVAICHGISLVETWNQPFAEKVIKFFSERDWPWLKIPEC